MINKKEVELLVDIALEARMRAYVPYSGFHVGAAVMTASGKVYAGCNIENASYTPTICAERTAIFKAISEGETVFSMLAIASDSDKNTFPCGVCRQVLAEFCKNDMPIACANKTGEYQLFSLQQLLPQAFTKEDLNK